MTPVCQYGECQCEAVYIIRNQHSTAPMKLCLKHALDLTGPDELAEPILDQLKPNVPIPPNLDAKLRKLHDAVYGNSTEANWRACKHNWMKDSAWLAKYNKI